MADNGKMVKYKAENVEITMTQLVKYLLRYVKQIAVCAVLAGILGASVTFLSPRVYQATSSMYVNYTNTSMGTVGGSPYTTTSESLNGAGSLVDTFGVLLMHNATLTEIIERCSLEYEIDDLTKMITYWSSGGQMIRVRVTSGKEEEAVSIAATIADIMPEKLEAQVEGCDVSVVEAGKLMPKQEGRLRKFVLNGAAGGVAGLLLACTALVALCMADRHIREAGYLCSAYPRVPLLTELPDGKAGPDASEEAYKLLRTYIMSPLPGEDDARMIGVTSALAGEGKSTAAVQLARVLALAEKKVLLLEGDMRHPAAAQMLGVRKAPGLAELLTAGADAKSAVQRCRDGYDVVASGQLPSNPSELLCSQQMQDALTQFRQQYDYVLVDLPAVMEAADAVQAARMTDAMLVVVRAEMADQISLAETMRRLGVEDARVLGFVFNSTPPEKQSKK